MGRKRRPVREGRYACFTEEVWWKTENESQPCPTVHAEVVFPTAREELFRVRVNGVEMKQVRSRLMGQVQGLELGEVHDRQVVFRVGA